MSAETGRREVLEDLIGSLAQGRVRVVDLTAPLEPATPTIRLPAQFAVSAPFSIQEICRYDSRGPAWYANNIACGEHTGTHFDAPVHWVTGKDCPNNSTDTIPVEKFVGRACVVDVSAAVRDDADYLVSQSDIEGWEEVNGRIPSQSWLLIRTDWSRRSEPADYLNMREDGAHTPGFHPACAQFLARERDILGVGVETVGTDAGQAGFFDPMFPCHASMHGANRFGLASLVNLDQLPATGAVIIAAPLKIVGGSGSPLRVLALVSAGDLPR